MTWRRLQEPLFPWAQTVDRIIASERPPAMTGPTLLVASDYGGTDKKSRYRVNAYLCVDIQASKEWEFARQNIRRRYLADGRRMSYKGLSDRQRSEALIPLLDAARELPGLCVLTITNRNLRHLCLMTESAHYAKMREVGGLQARWKDQELEEALRTTHLIGCLVGGLSRPGQNMYWISDEDNLFGNPKQSHDVARLLSSYSSHYARHPLGECGVGTTAPDEGDRFEEDLAAIPDLVAGAVAETTNRLAESCGGRIPRNLAVEYPHKFIPKADLIANWFWSRGGQLRRVAILFESHPGGQFAVSKHEMLT